MWGEKKLPPPKVANRQLTLLNADPWHGKRAKFYSRDPSNDEKYVEAFYQSSDRSFDRPKCQKKAIKAWQDVKGDNALLGRFLAAPVETRMWVLGIANLQPQPSGCNAGSCCACGYPCC